MASTKTPFDLEKKSVDDNMTSTPSISDGHVGVGNIWQQRLESFKQTFCTKEGWIGDYVSHEHLYLIGYILTVWDRTTYIL